MIAAITSAALLLLAASGSPADVRTEYGGWTKITGKTTGYFHPQKINGKWWCVDPSGAVFFVIGTDHVNYNVHRCEALGYAPYARNIRRKFNNDEQAWAKSSTDRLKEWSFNALGSNNSPSTRGHGLAYTLSVGMGTAYAKQDGLVERVYWTGFPNVFNPAFKEFCEEKAQTTCGPLKDDPWFFGWFLDNELEWFGKSGSSTALADEARKLPGENDAKKALVEMLKEKYSDIARFNAAWGTSFGSWEDALASTSWGEQANERVKADKTEFVRLCADRYFSITTSAIRKADPNHMILGCRFARRAPDVWDIAGKYCDIVSLNYYGNVDLETLKPVNLVEDLTRYYKQAKRPLMITEWSFPALDAGLPSIHGAGMRVATQADKAKCFEVYQKTFFSLPFVVGSDYFMWVDEPALGIAKHFPEDSNYGLVDVNDDPWKLFTEAVSRVNSQVYDIRSGRTVELSIADLKASESGLDLEIRNKGHLDADTSLAVRIDGRSFARTISVPAGSEQTVRVGAVLGQGAHYVEAEVNPDGKLAEVKLGDDKVGELVRIAGGTPGRTCVGVVALRSGRSVVSIPLSKVAGLPKKGANPSLLSSDGRPVKAEVIDIDRSESVTSADMLVFEADFKEQVPQTFSVDFTPGTGTGARLVKARSLTLATVETGTLELRTSLSASSTIDSIKLGDLPVGSFDVLMNQEGGGVSWTRPDKVEKILLWDGEIAKRLEVTSFKEMPEGGRSGVFSYRAVCGFTFYPHRRWFQAQFLSLENTDTRPWALAAYFYYPISAIGGSQEDDEVGMPGGGLGKAAWVDKKIGACYGVVAPPNKGMLTHFWKDEGGREHPDSRKPVNRQLKPGAVFTDDADPVYIFCSLTKDDPKPWDRIGEEISGLPKWEVW